MELQPRRSPYEPRAPAHNQDQREKCAVVPLCRPFHTVLLRPFDRLRPSPLPQPPGLCLLFLWPCPIPVSHLTPITSTSRSLLQVQLPPADLHGLSYVLLSWPANYYTSFCLIHPRSRSSPAILPEGGHAAACPLNPPIWDLIYP